MGVYIEGVDQAEWLTLHCHPCESEDVLEPPAGMVGVAFVPTRWGGALAVLWHKREAERLQPRLDVPGITYFLSATSEVVKALPKDIVKAMQADRDQGLISDVFLLSDSLQATEATNMD